MPISIELYRWQGARSRATSRNTNLSTAVQQSGQTEGVLPFGRPPRKPRGRRRSCSTLSPPWSLSSEDLLDSSLGFPSCQSGRSWEDTFRNDEEKVVLNLNLNTFKMSFSRQDISINVEEEINISNLFQYLNSSAIWSNLFLYCLAPLLLAGLVFEQRNF